MFVLIEFLQLPVVTGCFRINMPYFGRTFLKLNYINIAKSKCI